MAPNIGDGRGLAQGVAVADECDKAHRCFGCFQWRTAMDTDVKSEGDDKRLNNWSPSPW